MLIDHEAVVLELEEYIRTRSSHGRDPLLLKLSELRVAHRVPEGFLDRSLRLLGLRVTKEPLLSIVDPSPSDDDPARAVATGG